MIGWEIASTNWVGCPDWLNQLRRLAEAKRKEARIHPNEAVYKPPYPLKLWVLVGCCCSPIMGPEIPPKGFKKWIKKLMLISNIVQTTNVYTYHAICHEDISSIFFFFQIFIPIFPNSTINFVMQYSHPGRCSSMIQSHVVALFLLLLCVILSYMDYIIPRCFCFFHACVSWINVVYEYKAHSFSPLLSSSKYLMW